MKKRVNGQAKGAGFERECCLALSLWASGGARSDLFVRNVMSGGRFTIAMARDEDHGTPGDIAPAHPTAHAFTSIFQVECKSYKNLDWPAFIYDAKRSFLGKVIDLCEAQGKRSRQHYMVIAKQNQRKSVIIVDGIIGRFMLACAWPVKIMEYHLLHKEQYMVFDFRQVMDHVDPAQLLSGLRKQKET